MVLNNEKKMNELLLIKNSLNPQTGKTEYDILMCDCTGCDGNCNDQCDDRAEDGHCDIVFCPGVV